MLLYTAIAKRVLPSKFLTCGILYTYSTTNLKVVEVLDITYKYWCVPISNQNRAGPEYTVMICVVGLALHPTIRIGSRECVHRICIGSDAFNQRREVPVRVKSDNHFKIENIAV